jgi:hypothetical protein
VKRSSCATPATTANGITVRRTTQTSGLGLLGAVQGPASSKQQHAEREEGEVVQQLVVAGLDVTAVPIDLPGLRCEHIQWNFEIGRGVSNPDSRPACPPSTLLLPEALSDLLAAESHSPIH